MWPTWQLGPGIDIVGWAPPWILGGIECTNCAIVFVFGGFESNGVGCIGNGISIGYCAIVFVFGGFESNGVGCIGNGISIGYFAWLVVFIGGDLEYTY